VIDVGAHYGEYGRRLRNFVDYRGRIASFEPTSEAYEKLERRAASDPDWRIINCAPGASTSEKEINITRYTAVSSLLAPSPFANKVLEEKIDVVGREKVAGALPAPDEDDIGKLKPTLPHRLRLAVMVPIGNAPLHRRRHRALQLGIVSAVGFISSYNARPRDELLHGEIYMLSGGERRHRKLASGRIDHWATAASAGSLRARACPGRAGQSQPAPSPARWLPSRQCTTF